MEDLGELLLEAVHQEKQKILQMLALEAGAGKDWL
jgi:hypothetical protein